MRMSFVCGILERTDSVFFDCWTVCTKHQALRSLGKIRQSSNWQVFVVEFWIAVKEIIGLPMSSAVLLQLKNSVEAYFPDNRQDPRLRIIVPVGSDTQVDLFIKTILPVCSHKPEERIFRSLGHNISGEGGLHAGWRHLFGNLLKSRFRSGRHI